MKRISIGLIGALLLLLFVSAAGAETLYQLNYFELSLPEGWKYNKELDCYELNTGNSLQRITLLEYKNPFSGRPTLEEIVVNLKETMQLDDDYPEWEEIRIGDQQTAAVTLHSEGVRDIYIALFYSPFDRICYAIYSPSFPESGMAEMLAVLEGLHYRKYGEISYFRYGNAEVQYSSHKVQTVGKNNYLLVNFRWRNMGDEADMFVINVDVTAYQDGIELHPGYIFGINTEEGTKIMPGKEILVTKVFTLRKQTGTITLVVDKLLDVKNEWPNRKYEFQLK